MKKAFTMIELIFVIVILGILAAVAIPKLNATRDDAETAKAAQNLATLMSDLASYYTAQGKFDLNISTMTNVPLTLSDGNKTGTYKVKNADCVKFTIVDHSSAATGAIKIQKTSGTNAVCDGVLAMTAVSNLLSGSYTCAQKYVYDTNTSNYKADSTDTAGLAIDTAATLTSQCGTAATAQKVAHPVVAQPFKVDGSAANYISFNASGVKF